MFTRANLGTAYLYMHVFEYICTHAVPLCMHLCMHLYCNALHATLMTPRSFSLEIICESHPNHQSFLQTAGTTDGAVDEAPRQDNELSTTESVCIDMCTELCMHMTMHMSTHMFIYA